MIGQYVGEGATIVFRYVGAKIHSLVDKGNAGVRVSSS